MDNMGKLRFEVQTLRAAQSGAENPLPELSGHSATEMRRNFIVPDNADLFVDYGRVTHILPYLKQDGYERELADRPVRTVTLENDCLKAVFLPELGGRLWQLYDKEHARELVYHNPVLRFGELALRNQWFSGGIEWNIGMIGHHPHTCDTMFAGRVKAENGEDVLRLYQYERLRGVPYQLDIWLPDESRCLYVRVRIRNPHDHIVPMYWWSNIAVEEIPGGRVIVPAEQMYRYDIRTNTTRRVPIIRDGSDCTRYDTVPISSDFFFDIPMSRRKYAAHIAPDGAGLLQASTWRLKGRKLFVWGENTGGNRWQRFLTEGGGKYVEIQAGLAKTQSECLPMPAHAVWEWLETYSFVQTEPEKTLGGDWRTAQDSVCGQLERQHTEADLEALLEESRETVATRPVCELYTTGTGWGALEEERRRANGEEPLSDILSFREGRGGRQEPWHTLLTEGIYPARDAQEPPAPPVAGNGWKDRLYRACKQAPNWEAWYQLGVVFWQEREEEKAIEAWECSVQAADNAWARRTLAAAAKLRGDMDRARSEYRRAASLSKDPALCREYVAFLSDEQEDGRLLAYLEECPPCVRENSRVKYFEALALCRTGGLERCEAMLLENGGMEIAELHEGSEELSELWFLLQQKKGTNDPLPASLDFRMFV